MIYNEQDKRGVDLNNFQMVGGNLSKVATRLLDNEDLCKLLYFTEPNALDRLIKPKEKHSLFNKQIRIVPSLPKEDLMMNYIIIQFDQFSPSSNPKYRDYLLTFDVICNTQNWLMNDYMPRPYKIASELDKMFNNSKLLGIGGTLFLGMNSLIVNEDLMGFTLVYKITSEE